MIWEINIKIKNIDNVFFMLDEKDPLHKAAKVFISGLVPEWDINTEIEVEEESVKLRYEDNGYGLPVELVARINCMVKFWESTSQKDIEAGALQKFIDILNVIQDQSENAIDELMFISDSMDP